ncbi:hypothetical protein KUTeg_001995, partial [Tegillarca granosa]
MIGHKVFLFTKVTQETCNQSTPECIYYILTRSGQPASVCPGKTSEMSEKFDMMEKDDSITVSDSSLGTEESSTGSSEYERETWSRKTEYLLSMIGYSVGLGNIWRFSYICLRNGGGAFLIPFLFFLITCGIPLYFLEVSVGQFMGKGVVYFTEVAPLFRGLGYGMLMVSVIFAFYYNIITTWILYYIVNSFFNPLPWSTCGNSWNTKYCAADHYNTNSNITRNTSLVNAIQSDLSTMTSNITDNTTKINIRLVTPEEEFWEHQVLQMSSDLQDIGYFPWHLPVCCLVAWIIVFLSLMKGVKSVGKVVYVTATLPYLLLTVLLIRGIDGITYYLKPNFDRLRDKQVWLEAALQVFYSLGPCWGGLITMSSYTKFNNNCLRDAVILSLMSEGTSIFGGLAVFSILGFMASNLNLPIDKVVQSGPGLGFIVYPEALSLLPLPNFWSVLFFIMLLTVALDSIAGIYIFQLIDWYIAAFAVGVFGVLECVIYGWIYGIENLSRDITLMLGRPMPGILRFCICFVTPGVLLKSKTPSLTHVTFVFTMMSYQPPNYGTYIYPGYAQVIGWIIACIPVIPIPIYMVIQLKNAPGNSLYE